MSAYRAHRTVTIRLEPDPDLVPGESQGERDVNLWSYGAFCVHLIPTSAGVRLSHTSRVTGGSEPMTHAAAVFALLQKAARWDGYACCAPEGTATRTYAEDRCNFYLRASHAVDFDPRCRALWGLS
jgi:hypothetical protein